MFQKYSVTTTFNKPGYDKYGSRMIQSFIQNWPTDVTLYVYAEDCTVKESAANVVIRDLHSTIPALVAFKERWKNDPKAVGQLATGPVDRKGKQPGIGFRWDAIRFSHKVYSVCYTGLNCDADILFWMDADTICHSPISLDIIKKLCPKNIDLCYFGRNIKYSECGLYSMNLKSKNIQNFLKEFQKMYDDAEQGIFTLTEWHDSFVFDAIRTKFKNQLKEFNWSAGIVNGEGHPLINTAWGAYLDHLKGERKTLGRSKSKDLKIQRTEKYWQ